jgi:Family of unknown function (DUF5991)
MKDAPRYNLTFRNLCVLIISLIFSNCNNNSDSKLLVKWTGDYHYEETPIKAIGGYQMIMDWTLSIAIKNDSTIGILEVNGQLTFIKLKTNIIGDTSKIAVIYNSVLEGSNEDLKQGDTLFTLSNATKELTTNWFKLKPRLSTNPSENCICFLQN